VNRLAHVPSRSINSIHLEKSNESSEKQDD